MVPVWTLNLVMNVYMVNVNHSNDMSMIDDGPAPIHNEYPCYFSANEDSSTHHSAPYSKQSNENRLSDCH